MSKSMSSQPSDGWTISGRTAASAGVIAPVRGSVRYSSAAGDWQPSEAEGFWTKLLYEDAQLGEKTMLMKVDAGAFAGSHTHPGEFEQIYVMEGSFYDQDGILQAGDYCCRAPDAAHTSGSEHGAVVMVIYTRRDPRADNS